jgi:hypothetical protein
MSEPEVSDEFLIDLLRERGYEVSKPAEPDLAAKIAAVEQNIDEMGAEPAAPASPEEQRVRFAEQFRDRLNASMSKWYEPGDDRAA